MIELLRKLLSDGLQSIPAKFRGLINRENEIKNWIRTYWLYWKLHLWICLDENEMESIQHLLYDSPTIQKRRLQFLGILRYPKWLNYVSQSIRKDIGLLASNSFNPIQKSTTIYLRNFPRLVFLAKINIFFINLCC